ncbi:hypothetical protein FRC03_002122 [Tulasnella sp. 419]|nr:hypothetical protein FRC03_002122 [Tulasnella sp. 419]
MRMAVTAGYPSDPPSIQCFKEVPVYEVPVIRQPDMVDCGLYPAHFLSVFMLSPEE